MYNNDDIFIITAQDFHSIEMMIGHLNQTLWELFNARRVNAPENSNDTGQHIVAFYNESKLILKRLEHQKDS